MKSFKIQAFSKVIECIMLSVVLFSIGMLIYVTEEPLSNFFNVVKIECKVRTFEKSLLTNQCVSGFSLRNADEAGQTNGILTVKFCHPDGTTDDRCFSIEKLSSKDEWSRIFEKHIYKVESIQFEYRCDQGYSKQILYLNAPSS
jgi:predicted membrane channel-forming protein YqfA (hemolysin III family)